MKPIARIALYYLTMRLIFLLVILFDYPYNFLFPEGVDETPAIFLRGLIMPAAILGAMTIVERTRKAIVVMRLQDILRSIGRTHGGVALTAHMVWATIYFAIVLVDLAPLYLPVVFGETASGIYTGEWKERNGWPGKTWRCVFEFETAKGTFNGTLAGTPESGEENKREICLANGPEQVVYYPANPEYHYPLDRSKPLLFNYPATGLALVAFCTGIFYVCRLRFFEGYDEEGNDCNLAFRWGLMCLVLLLIM